MTSDPSGTDAAGDAGDTGDAARAPANVELLYFDGCPNHDELLARVTRLLARSATPTRLVLHEITDEQSAQRARFLGSPTVRVDGRDIEPDAATRIDFAVRCRLYRTPDGLRGIPPDAWILAALDERRDD